MAKKQIFELIEIKDREVSFIAEVEIIETRKRRRFGYPRNEGWENIINGEPKFISDIREKLEKEQILINSQDFNIGMTSIKTDFIGKKF